MTISANGCPQNYQVVWENDYIPKGISSTVMSLSDTKTFQAYCSPLDEGCSSEESNSITIAVNLCNNSSIPSPAFSPSSATINLNESYTIQTNGICGANTFQWVSGPASNPVQRAGTYTAVCKNTAGCFSATSSFTLNVNNDPCVTATIASPVFSPSGATINEGQTYTLPTDVCNNGNRFEWRVAPPSNPVGVAGTYTAICKSIDGCVSGTSSFSLMVNGRTLNVSKSNPSCFNNDGSFQVTINGSSGENFLYTLINTANNQTIYGGQDDGTMHSFSGLPQGSYKILVQVKGTSVYYESYQTLTKVVLEEES
ncbi:hypothetical protein ACFFJX_14320 [Pseudarcicella hirudinis]|uniref:hypothetical protein n=1 Tax=Pseudarcicella hirudinis TaxID=1079859 RepID=UPI0035EB3B1C